MNLIVNWQSSNEVARCGRRSDFVFRRFASVSLCRFLPMSVALVAMTMMYGAFQVQIASAQTSGIASPQPSGSDSEVGENQSGAAQRLESRSGELDSVRSRKSKKLDFEKKGGIVYRKTDEYELKCDVYIPAGSGPFPAILAVHGGAWRQGTKFALLRHAWRMAQSGYVVVAINYRHAPKYPFPAQIHDCKHAVRWIKTNADKFKIDPAKIGGFGYSAGGHLVSMLGATDADDGLEGDVDPALSGVDSRIECVIAGGAPCEFSWIDGDSRVLSYWLGGSRNEKPEAFNSASPASYVTSDDPPFFFFHGEGDLIVPVKTSQKMHRLLQSSAVDSQHHVAPNNGHIGTFSDLTWMDKAIEFLDSKLKSP